MTTKLIFNDAWYEQYYNFLPNLNATSSWGKLAKPIKTRTIPIKVDFCIISPPVTCKDYLLDVSFRTIGGGYSAIKLIEKGFSEENYAETPAFYWKLNQVEFENFSNNLNNFFHTYEKQYGIEIPTTIDKAEIYDKNGNLQRDYNVYVVTFDPKWMTSYTLLSCYYSWLRFLRDLPDIKDINTIKNYQSEYKSNTSPHFTNDFLNIHGSFKDVYWYLMNDLSMFFSLPKGEHDKGYGNPYKSRRNHGAAGLAYLLTYITSPYTPASTSQITNNLYAESILDLIENKFPNTYKTLNKMSLRCHKQYKDEKKLQKKE